MTKVSVSFERNFSAHHMLLDAARIALENAEQKTPSSFHYELIVITMSALAIEAICNAVGERVINDWKDFESCSSKAKARLLCDFFGISYSSTTEPWSTISWLGKLRNDLAHSKPQYISENHQWTKAEYDKKLFYKPKSRLEKTITLGHAKRAYLGVAEMKSQFFQKIPENKSFGLSADMWSGGTS